jgi:hypothetical protein
VVWKKVDGKMKGVMVVNLRALNKIAVPDAHPMPLQSHVVDVLRGKQAITVIDASSFFHQFEVKKEQEKRFTIVSHRGQGISLVALMGLS